MSINYIEIIEELELDKIKSLLESLHIPYRDTDKALIMPTVCHNADADEASWKLYYYKDSHSFYCYTECGSMSIFKFLKHFYDARDIAYDWYTDILQVILNCSASGLAQTAPDAYKSHKTDYEPQKARKPLPTYPNGLIDVFVREYPIEWLQEGITKETMDKYNIRYSISQNKIIIPHYNVDGELVGIRGRALNEEDIEQFGKYMPVQIENKWYSHPLSLNLYGLNLNKDNIKNSMAFIFEGEKSTLLSENFSRPNRSVASCGSNLNKYQVDLLMRYCAPREIVVCYDQEELPNEHKYFDKLYNTCLRYINYCNFSFIYDRNGLLKLKDSPVDRGEDIFNQLLKMRVPVR